MKKLLYILAATFMVASCCTNSVPLNRTETSIRVDGNHYYKVKIENHTYIMITSYYRMGLEHDPECPYCKEHGFPKK